MSGAVICKRGDTIQLSCVRKDPITGAAVSLADTTVVSEMVQTCNRVSWTTEVIDAADGTFRMTLPAVTSTTLTVGEWECDIEFRGTDGSIKSSMTFSVNVLKDITNGAC